MARLVASFFGTGLILGKLRGADAGSGTVSGFFALGLALLIDPGVGRVVALLLAVLIGGLALAALKVEDGDPPWVTIDEAAGTFLATLGLGLSGAVAGFAVFRVADIQKRWFPGVARAERLGRPVGVMADDLVAGLYGLAAGWLVHWLIG